VRRRRRSACQSAISLPQVVHCPGFTAELNGPCVLRRIRTMRRRFGDPSAGGSVPSPSQLDLARTRDRVGSGLRVLDYLGLGSKFGSREPVNIPSNYRPMKQFTSVTNQRRHNMVSCIMRLNHHVNKVHKNGFMDIDLHKNSGLCKTTTSIRKPTLKFLGLAVRKILHISCVCVSRPVALTFDLKTGMQCSTCHGVLVPYCQFW